MDNNTYLSIESAITVTLREKGSRFIGYAFPVASEEGVQQALSELKQRYPDASHHCYAYRLGADGQRYRAQDDGEPSGSAGIPILNQLRSKQLSDVLLVVVRYFGGTKLGVSGLIATYKATAAAVLEQAITVEKHLSLPISLTFGYDKSHEVMQVLKAHRALIEAQEFGEICRISARIRQKDWRTVQEKLADFIDETTLD
jgi:uncharacterized YigZ family protein